MSQSFSDRLAEALALHQGGEPAEAARRYAALLEERPGEKEVLYYQAVLAYQAGRWAEAIAAAQKTLPGGPMEARAHNLTGLSLAKSGKLEEALEAYAGAIAVKPDYADAYGNRANALADLGREEEALADYDAALKIRPDSAEDWTNRGNLLLAMDRPEEAIVSYDRAIAIAPNNAEIHHNKANALQKLDRKADMLESYDRALELDPTLGGAWLNRAILLRAMGRENEALESANRGIAVSPRTAQALAIRGNLHHETGNYDAAYADYDAAAKLDPSLPGPPLSRSFIALTRGDWAAAFPDFEYRAKAAGKPAYENHAWPRWRGEQLGDARLIIVCEQGLGDMIQFARFAPFLKGRGHDVALLSTPTMLPLFSSLGVPVITSTDELPADGRPLRWVPVMSLIDVLHLTPDTVPADIPYLSAEPEAVATWRKRIGEHGFKIGIQWGTGPGGLSHLLYRSVPLTEFAALAQLPGVRLISLQRDAAAEIAAVPFGDRIETLGPDADVRGRFLDTAAALIGLDLVVTSDTSVAHLAGALGRPVFLALPFVADWRWLLDREDTSWYPTMRLFRQQTHGDWPGVFARIREAVQARVEARGREPATPAVAALP